MVEPFIEGLKQHEILGAAAREKLVYYPTITREAHANRGRLTTLIVAGKLFRDVGLPVFNPQHDRVMVCGSPSMLAETCRLLDSRGFKISDHIGKPGDYVVER